MPAGFFLAAALIEILLPIALALYLRRKYGVSWKIFLIGAVMFAFSLIRIPLNTAFSSSIHRYVSGLALYLSRVSFPDLTAGLFEESVRYDEVINENINKTRCVTLTFHNSLGEPRSNLFGRSYG
ncbi:MAG: YhfC family glutamic-type intramembrane protease [Candidatus Geothermarchaeales archaeon]